MSPRHIPAVMVRMRPSRHTEAIVYIVLWLTVATVYLLNAMGGRTSDGIPVRLPLLLWQTFSTLLPYFLLFVANNFILIPRLLLPGRTAAYFGLVILLVGAVWGWQYHEFETIRHMHPRPPLPDPPGHPHRGGPLPLPLLLDFIYTLLVVGANLSIALLFRRFEDRIEHEQLLKAHAEERLASLRAQINPHFYMNMLNNIHGMIEIDPAEAQGMVLDMSALMRYSLYESRNVTIPLAKEIAFLANYIGLMRRRYPANRVTVTTDFPEAADTRGIQVPPLIFLVFIENAFKHGVSYRAPSFVSVSVKVDADGTVLFECLNSLHTPQGNTSPTEEGGIGLDNVSQRLGLTYGGRARLTITQSADTYHVHLTLPPAP